MMDTTNLTAHLTQQLTAMATRLEAFDVESAQRLRALSAALADEAAPEINAWANADLYHIIDPDAIILRYREQQAQQQQVSQPAYTAWLTPMRYTLLGLPLIISCSALAQAVGLYTGFAQSHAQANTQSFLYLWQQGFGGQLASWARPGTVASIAAFLILLVLLITLWQHIQATRQQHQQLILAAQQQQSVATLRSDLAHLLAQLVLYLAQQRSQLTTADNLTQVARRIDSMSRRMEEKLESVVGKFTTMTQNVTNDFNSMSQELTQNYDDTLNELTSKQDGMSQQIMKRFSALNDRMMEQLLSGNTYLKELGKMTGGIVQTAEQIQQASTTLKETNSELTFNIKNLVGPVVDLAQQQEVLITATSQALENLQSVAKTLQAHGLQQERWGTDLRNILDSLDLAVERSTDVILKVGDFTTRQEELLQQLQKQLPGTANVSQA
ncbi:hypothetical protein ccbrp13_46280 [Ktedonobacteria bacterium brp13]|nr:hypothetical protein ccbrp13_46280 [Ktedonobacteria bacterium brp13]